MTDDEIKALAKTITPDDLHKLMLAMVDQRMDADANTPNRGAELEAIAAACEAYEKIVYPV